MQGVRIIPNEEVKSFSYDKNIIVYKHIGPLTEKNFKGFYKKVKESYN